MLLEDLDLLAAHRSCLLVWGWGKEEEWQCMRRWSSSLEDSLRRDRSIGVGQWAKRGRQGRWGQS